MVIWLATVVRVKNIEPCGGLSLRDPGAAGFLSERDRFMKGGGLLFVVNAEKAASFI